MVAKRIRINRESEAIRDLILWLVELIASFNREHEKSQEKINYLEERIRLLQNEPLRFGLIFHLQKDQLLYLMLFGIFINFTTSGY